MNLVPLPLLITGIAGVHGYNAFHHFRRLYGDAVIGIRQSTMWPLKGDGIVGCDPDDRQAVDRLWDEYQFASMLNCAGSCHLKSCERDRGKAHRLNVAGAENLVRAAVRHRARVIHISVDLVFGGRPGGNYVETDPTDPVTVYGEMMVQAERMVQRHDPAACILRISLPMGISFNGHAGAIDWISSRFKAGKPATLFTDEYRTPTYTDCLNVLFEQLLTRPLSGLYHAGGPRSLCLFQIGQIVNAVGGYDPTLLRGIPRSQAPPVPPRAGDVTMDSSKLTEALGFSPFDPWPLHDRLLPPDSTWHHRRQAFDGAPELVHRWLYQHPERESEVPLSRNELWTDGRFSA
jgi:dTDP-4-dehydrorhamnose reductase